MNINNSKNIYINKNYSSPNLNNISKISEIKNKQFQNNHDISYSMIIDKDIEYIRNKNEIEKVRKNNSKYVNVLIKERKIHNWVDDATECYECKTLFTFFIRKHHCRYCGRIFCYICSNYWIKIPEYIDKPKNITHWEVKKYLVAENLHRVCKKCKTEIIEIIEIKKYNDIFSLLDLNLIDYMKMLKVCKLWRKIANNYLSKFREIQYLLPEHNFNDNEKKILWNNRYLIKSHSKYFLQFLKSINWLSLSDNDKKDIQYLILNKNKKKYSCWYLMCSRDCKENLTSCNALELIYPRFNYTFIRKYALDCLNNCSYVELSCYLTFLVYQFRIDIDGLIFKFLLKKARLNDIFKYDLYWQLVMFLSDNTNQHINNIYKNMIQILKSNLNIKSNTDFISIMNLIRKNKGNYNNIPNIIKSNISLITNNKNITIQYDDIEVKNSISKPVIIPYLIKNVNNNNIQKKLMFKYEDIRKEHIIMNVIKYMDVTLRKEGINLNITKYKIIPIDNNGGFIEIVNNAETLYHIKEKLNFSIQNYIIEKNNGHSINKIRHNYMKSCISYCLISYLLGIGDRHLDNIMITDNGLLFHIDFGYILGSDPKFLAPEIRLTVEMIDAMGGSNSKYYKEFKFLCTKSYNILRRHTNTFLILLSSLAEINPKIDNGYYTKNFIKEQVLKRFIPGETYENAKLQYITKINNTQFNTKTDTFIDYLHYQRKENINKLENIINIFGSTIYNYLTNSSNNIL